MTETIASSRSEVRGQRSEVRSHPTSGLGPPTSALGPLPTAEQFIIARLAAGFAPPFRGEIYDYARHIELGSSYEVPAGNVCRHCAAKGVAECRHFEIDTARQLIGPFKAIADPNVQMVMLLKATQTLGSLWWDLTLHYLIVHSDYSTFIVFMESDEKALTYCDKRLMPTLKANPDIAPLLPSGPDRHDNTKTDIKFTNGKLLRVCGLNDSNASSLTWQVVIIDEGWLHGADGLMQKAIDRSKQVARRKILIVGQAGKKDEDQDRLWQRCYQVPLTFACPCCGGRQQFGPHGPAYERPEDFKPRTEKLIVPGSAEWNQRYERLALPELPLPPTPPKPGSYGGLSVDKRFSEISDPQEMKLVASQAVLECYHCGFEIPDTPVMRRALMATYEQEYQIVGGEILTPDTSHLTPLSRYTPAKFEVGFWNPDPASITIPFAQTMQEYIIAKLAAARLGNRRPLEGFYQNRWASAWDDKLARDLRRRNQDSYDVALAQHDAWRLCMIVDNQLDLLTQWVMVLAVKKDGSMRQIWRGAIHGLAECRKKQLEYGADAKGHPVLKDQFVFLDGRYKPEQICGHIVEHKYGHWGTFQGEREWFCWNLMQGTRYDYFTHEEEQDKTRKFICGDAKFRGYTLDGWHVDVLVYPFAATACGERFEARRDGLGAETKWLERQKDEPPDDHELSHNSQIFSNKLVPSKSFAPREARMMYVPVPQGAPDHYFHMWRMAMAVEERWGIDGVYRAAVVEVSGAEGQVSGEAPRDA